MGARPLDFALAKASPSHQQNLTPQGDFHLSPLGEVKIKAVAFQGKGPPGPYPSK